VGGGAGALAGVGAGSGGAALQVDVDVLVDGSTEFVLPDVSRGVGDVLGVFAAVGTIVAAAAAVAAAVVAAVVAAAVVVLVEALTAVVAVAAVAVVGADGEVLAGQNSGTRDSGGDGGLAGVVVLDWLNHLRGIVPARAGAGASAETLMVSIAGVTAVDGVSTELRAAVGGTASPEVAVAALAAVDGVTAELLATNAAKFLLTPVELVASASPGAGLLGALDDGSVGALGVDGLDTPIDHGLHNIPDGLDDVDGLDVLRSVDASGLDTGDLRLDHIRLGRIASRVRARTDERAGGSGTERARRSHIVGIAGERSAGSTLGNAVGVGSERSNNAIRAGPGRSNNAIRVGPGRSNNAIRLGPERSNNAIRAGPERSNNAIRVGPGRSNNAIRLGPERSNNAIRAGPERSNNAIRVGPGRSNNAIRLGPERSNNAIRAGPERSNNAIRVGSGRSNNAIGAGPERSSNAIRVGSERSSNATRVGSEARVDSSRANAFTHLDYGLLHSVHHGGIGNLGVDGPNVLVDDGLDNVPDGLDDVDRLNLVGVLDDRGIRLGDSGLHHVALGGTSAVGSRASTVAAGNRVAAGLGAGLNANVDGGGLVALGVEGPGVLLDDRVDGFGGRVGNRSHTGRTDNVDWDNLLVSRGRGTGRGTSSSTGTALIYTLAHDLFSALASDSLTSASVKSEVEAALGVTAAASGPWGSDDDLGAGCSRPDDRLLDNLRDRTVVEVLVLRTGSGVGLGVNVVVHNRGGLNSGSWVVHHKLGVGNLLDLGDGVAGRDRDGNGNLLHHRDVFGGGDLNG